MLRDDWSTDDVSLKKWERGVANSNAHKREGQNVCYGDGHVTFEKRPDVGVRNDNIYTIEAGGSTPEESRRRGIMMSGMGEGKPQNANDSYLVNDDERGD